MKGRPGKSEAAALRLSEAARTVLVRAAFDGNAWSLRLLSDEVTTELKSANMARETASGMALTDIGMRVRAIAVRLAHNKAMLSALTVKSKGTSWDPNNGIADLTVIMLNAKTGQNG